MVISVGLSTFRDELQGRRVVIYSDNTGAEALRLPRVCVDLLPIVHVAQGTVKRGSSRAWDQSLLIHEIWTLVRVAVACTRHRGPSRNAQAWLYKMHIWIERVPSDDNISDLPSRESYELMRELGAKWRAPVMAHVFLGRGEGPGVQESEEDAWRKRIRKLCDAITVPAGSMLDGVIQ